MVIHVGYVVNNYSSSGQVQARAFGYHDNIQDDKNLPWVYPSQGTNNMGVAGIGENHNLQPGCRIAMLEYGGPDGSLIGVGTMGRMGSPPGGGGGGVSSSDDQGTSWTNLNVSQTDYPVSLKNPGAPNGQRAIAKQPSSEYYPPGDGKPFVPKNDYPNTPFWTNGA